MDEEMSKHENNAERYHEAAYNVGSSPDMIDDYEFDEAGARLYD